MKFKIYNMKIEDDKAKLCTMLYCKKSTMKILRYSRILAFLQAIQKNVSLYKINFTLINWQRTIMGWLDLK